MIKLYFKATYEGIYRRAFGSNRSKRELAKKVIVPVHLVKRESCSSVK